MRTKSLLTALLMLGIAATPAIAKDKKEAEAKAAEPKAEGEAKKPSDPAFAETIDGFDKVEGLFTFYRKASDGKVLMEIMPAQLDEIYLASLTRDAAEGFFFDSGAQLGNFPFTFRRVGKKIHWVATNVAFRADKAAAISRAIGSLSDSVLGSAAIASMPHPDSGSILIDPTSLFIKDIAGVGAVFKEIDDFDFRFDKEHSYFGEIKSFEKNAEIDAVIYFATDSPGMITTLPDPRSFRHIYRYSLSALPDSGFEPRLADDRVGHFLTMHRDYSSQLQDTSYVRYVNRWQLDKAEGKFDLSKPRQPIVYWMENTIPVQFRDSVRAGIELWNDAFEQIGFKDAIVVKQQPDDADWDPADVRYNTVRWILQPGGGYAVGPSRTDPYTGQIYDADIRVSADMIRSVYSEWEEVAAPRVNGDAIAAELGLLDFQAAQCDHMLGASQQAAFGYSLASARAAAGGDSVDMERFIHEFIVELVAHEVGHTLGLRHNFKASTIKSVDDLHGADGIHTASVMDYNPVNISAKGEHQGSYYQTVLGPYDYWAIEYAYKQIDGDEAEALEAIASRASEPQLQYGTDEDAFFGARGMDPTATRWDLGSDNIDFYRGRIQMAEELWAGIESNFEHSGERYQKIRRVFGQGFGEYFGAVMNVSKWVGGVYHRRDHIGDPGGRLPYEPVAAARQREALAFLADEVFAADAFDFPRPLLNKLATERFPDFSYQVWSASRNDYPIHDAIGRIHGMALSHLMSPTMMSRVLDVEMRGGDSLGLVEIFETLRTSVWSELDAATSVTSTRRNLQRMHLDALVALVVSPPAGTPEDASSLARADLRSLGVSIDQAMSSGSLDAISSAHFDESRAVIGAALEAGINRRIDS